MGRGKFGYVQQSVLSKSRIVLDQQTTLVLLRLCHDVCICEVYHNMSFFIVINIMEVAEIQVLTMLLS